MGLLSGISKLEQKRSLSICEFNFFVEDKWKTETKKNSLITYALKSIIWDELEIETVEIPKVIYHIWDEIKIKANKM